MPRTVPWRGPHFKMSPHRGRNPADFGPVDRADTQSGSKIGRHRPPSGDIRQNSFAFCGI